MMRMITSIFILLCLSCVQVLADEVRDALAVASKRFYDTLERIDNDVQTELQLLIDAQLDAGDLEKAQKYISAKESFASDGILPDVIGLQKMRSIAKREFASASRELRTAYETAIRDYTRGRNLRAAQQVKDALDDLIASQNDDILKFPRNPKNQKRAPADSPEKELDEDLPDRAKKEMDALPAPVFPNSVKAMPNMAPRNAVGNKSSSKDTQTEPVDLAEYLASEAERLSLSNKLATTQQRLERLEGIVQILYRQLPPSQWTAQQCDAFVEFLVPAVVAIDPTRGISIYDLAPDDLSGNMVATNTAKGVSGSPESVRRFLAGRPCMQWLISSDGVDEFISRAAHLQSKIYWPYVDEQIKIDDIKSWLHRTGNRDLEEVRSVLSGLTAKGIRISAVQKFLVEVQ